MSPPVSGGGGNAACAPQHHTPPFSFPGKKTGGVTVQKKGVCIASEQLEELQRLPMLLPARGVAAFEAAIRFASAPIIRCCAAVGGSAALRMRHTPCGCRSAHLVEVQPNFRLLPVSTMRRAQQCRYFARSLPPCYRHSRLTTVRRGCKRSRIAGIHGEAMYTALTLRSACSPSSCKPAMAGSRGRAPCVLLGVPRGPFSHVREWPPFPYPPRVWGKCSTTYKWSISAHSTVYISSRCRRGRDRCGRSSGPCGAAFSPCRRRRWRRRCRRPRARA